MIDVIEIGLVCNQIVIISHNQGMNVNQEPLFLPVPPVPTKKDTVKYFTIFDAKSNNTSNQENFADYEPFNSEEQDQLLLAGFIANPTAEVRMHAELCKKYKLIEMPKLNRHFPSSFHLGATVTPNPPQDPLSETELLEILPITKSSDGKIVL